MHLMQIQIQIMNKVIRKTLLSGAYGQVGQELFRSLASRYGPENVVCTDVRHPPKGMGVVHHQILDVKNREHLFDTIRKHNIDDVYCLAALLSASGERYPLYTEHINMTALFNCLEAARYGFVKKIFWPSSIAAFGNSPKQSPQKTIQEPTTVYGITKKNGELWCNYYFNRYGVDVRSIRYPGLVGWRSPPGGGTTDYAVDIFHKAVLGETYTCYLHEDTVISMVYMEDAIEGTLKLMDCEQERVLERNSYNIQAMKFTPKEIAQQIKKHIPTFKINYEPEELRQKIADSWPQEFVDKRARRDWDWDPKYDLERMVKDMLKHLTPELVKSMNTKN